MAFDYFAQWTKNQALAAAARFNLLLAAILTVPVVGAGGVAVGARRPKDKRDPVNAPDLRMHIERVDLAGVLDPLACAPASGKIITKVPVADRSARGLYRWPHRSSWRISQWGQTEPHRRSRPVAADFWYRRCKPSGKRWLPRNRRFTTRGFGISGFKE